MVKETEAAVMRRKFRASKKWQDFHKRVFDKQNGKCYITGKKLQKRAECHHLDQRAENYKNLDIERFVMLNPMMHKVVHNIFRYWSKDKSILNKIEKVLLMMEEYSNDSLESCKAEDPRVVENQSKFCKAYTNWIYSNKQDKKAWETMFLCVQLACENICKSKAYGIQVEDLEGKALDAACNCMAKLSTFTKIEECPKLSSWCYLYSIGQLWHARHRRWEQSESFDGLFDNYSYYNDENGFMHVCSMEY